jgi:hypothetical protein
MCVFSSTVLWEQGHSTSSLEQAVTFKEGKA